MPDPIRVARRHLSILAADQGTFQLPEDHLFGMKVPKGGSSCAKCTFVSKDRKHCGSKFFQSWRQSLGEKDPTLLPDPADEYCCDVFAWQQAG